MMRNLLKNLMLALCLLAAGATAAHAQTPAPTSTPAAGVPDIGITPNLALGDVTAIDAAGSRLTVKTKDGEITVLLDAATEYKRTQPGARDLKGATAITLAEVSVGDRVIARGKVAADRKSVPARQLIVMTKADIAKKQEHDRQEWQRRGIVGRIVALNPESKEINLLMRSREGDKPITIDVAGDVTFRRYAPDSVKFSDALPSSFAELKAGDQLRALGEKSADQTRFTPEEIVSGSFRMVGGPITAVNAAAGEVVINNLQTGQPITVVVNQDSILRRIPQEMAAMMAQRRAAQAAGGAGSGGAPPAGRADGEDGNGQGRPRGGGGPDFDAMIERLPPVSVSELKQGDVIAVSSTTGVDPTRVTAIKLVAGIEALMTRPQAGQGRGAGAAQSPSLNLPGLDSIGAP